MTPHRTSGSSLNCKYDDKLGEIRAAASLPWQWPREKRSRNGAVQKRCRGAAFAALVKCGGEGPCARALAPRGAPDSGGNSRHALSCPAKHVSCTHNGSPTSSSQAHDRRGSPGAGLPPILHLPWGKQSRVVLEGARCHHDPPVRHFQEPCLQSGSGLTSFPLLPSPQGRGATEKGCEDASTRSGGGGGGCASEGVALCEGGRAGHYGDP